jgi:thioredoxin-related protein
MKLLLAVALALAAGAARANEIPAWFAETFLDVREDAAEAAKEGKRLMYYFWLEGCPYCEKMEQGTFRDAAVVERMKRGFVAVAINVRGDREVTWSDGARLTEKTLTAQLKVRGTPTMLFFDAKGAIALRLAGYLAPAEFARALDSLSTAPTAGPRSASPK